MTTKEIFKFITICVVAFTVIVSTVGYVSNFLELSSDSAFWGAISILILITIFVNITQKFSEDE